MKSIFKVVATLIIAATSFRSLGQGQVLFDNTVQVPNGAPIWEWEVGPNGVKGPGSTVSAHLYLVDNGTLTLLATTTFLDIAGGGLPKSNNRRCSFASRITGAFRSSRVGYFGWKLR
jgi:hypothetical protein